MSGNINFKLDVFRACTLAPESIEVTCGQSLFVGSGESCGIKIAGADVAQFHCRIEICENDVVVQDCGTGKSTQVNGQVVEGDVSCQNGDVIEIGDCRLVVSCIDELAIQVADANPVTSAASTSPESVTDHEFTGLDSVRDEDGYENDVNSFESSEEDSLVADSDPWLEGECEANGLVGFDDPDETEGLKKLMAEEMDLLRSEIEFLQNEITVKDQQIAEFLSGESSTGSGQHVSNDETERLVVRLEELLEELRQSDERAKTLEDLLRLCEEANLAEKEERLQVEKWLGEVESRVAQNEAEKDAEIDSLKKRLVATQKRQKNAEVQLKKVLSGATVGDAGRGSAKIDSTQVNAMQQKIEQLERLLEATQQEKLGVESQLQELQKLQSEAIDAQAVEQKLIQMELETSRERAELARERAELEAKLERVESADARPPKLDASDYRFAAMRDHLREIHEEEKMMKLQKQQNSLGGRIARLLKRN